KGVAPMARLSTKILLLAAFATPALGIACSSSSTNATGTRASTTTSHMGGSTTTSSHSTSSTSSSAADGGDAGHCTMNCINSNMTAAQKFEVDEVMSCGCGATGPCKTQCTAECANPSTLMQSTPCGMCLLAEANKKTMSTCTVAAAGVCQADTTC